MPDMAEPVGLPAAVETLPEAIAWWAVRTPAAPALRALDRADVSYAELESRVRAGVAYLRALGIAQRDHVALVLHRRHRQHRGAPDGDVRGHRRAVESALSPTELVRIGALACPRRRGRSELTLPHAAAALGLPVIPAERLFAPPIVWRNAGSSGRTTSC